MPGRKQHVGLSPATFIGGLKEMDDLFNLVMLICASIFAMAFGVLVAYGIFRAGFAMMRPRSAKPAVKATAQLAAE
jgi:hypothetical protein